MKKQKTIDGVIIKKSIKCESTKSGNEIARKRSASPISGTSKYFDLIENQVPKEREYNKKEEKLLSPQNSKPSRKVSCDESEEKQKRIKPQLVVKERSIPISPDPSEDIFEKIVEICKKKNDSNEIEVVLKKIKLYYDKLEPADKNCEKFKLFLNSYLNKILNADRYYKHLLDIKNEIIHRLSNKKNAEVTEEIELSEEERRTVKKLEKVIRKCKERIENLENQEVDFDDEDNSAYIIVDRYKRKLVELCAELSKVANDKMLKKQIHKRLLRRRDIPDEMTGIIYVDDAIIRFVNSSIRQANELKHIKNPNAIAAYLFMPDYVDILQCIKQCNEEKNLELKNKKMEKLAENAFKAVGNYLKNQRLQDIYDYLSSFVENSKGDPAKDNQDLRKKLKSNREVGVKKLEEIFAKYVAKQKDLSSKRLDTDNEENDSCEDENNDEDNSTNEIEDISSSPNEDNPPSRDEGNSFDNDKRSIKRKRIIQKERNITEKNLKHDNDNDSIKIGNENIKVLKETNVGKVYPLQTRDNQKKLVFDQSVMAKSIVK